MTFGKIAFFKLDEIDSDVLDRIAGYNVWETGDPLNDGTNQRIYEVSVLTKIMNDPEDDTNESTKCKIESLLNQMFETIGWSVSHFAVTVDD
jgi:hypothetical protein